MKILIAFLLLTIFIGCKGKDKETKTIRFTATDTSGLTTTDSLTVVVVPSKPKEEFHVKVMPFSDCLWQVIFTNDGWNTQEEIMSSFDLSESWGEYRVIHQTELWEEDIKAVAFAKRLLSYKDCIKYNEKILAEFNRLDSYRKRHPITSKPEYLPNCPKNRDEIKIH